jgi:diguanylate cyclase (GGDEF)-like protein
MELERIQRTYRNLEQTHHLLTHLHGEIAALRGRFREAILVLRSLQNRADRDELTGLYRRSAWKEGVRSWFETPREASKGGEDGIHVLVLDLDYFKRINDQLGHAHGDRVLKRVGDVLCQLTKVGGVVAARFGGEEFVVAVRGKESRAVAVGEWVRRTLARSSGPSFTASVGVRLNVGRMTDLEAALGDADRALYRAKELGRNRLVWVRRAKFPRLE